MPTAEIISLAFVRRGTTIEENFLSRESEREGEPQSIDEIEEWESQGRRNAARQLKRNTLASIMSEPRR